VSNVPGAIVLTRICQLARSRAATSVIPWTAAFEALYDVWPICPSNAATEAVRTHAPRSPSMMSFRLIAAAHSRRTLYVPTRLVWITSLKDSRPPGLPSRSMIRVRSPPRPAQCTSARNGPRSTATSTAALTAASSVTSAAANRAASPISAATAAPPLLGRSTIVTDAPISASRRAVAQPRPEAPPVTRAEIPLIRMRAPRERHKPSDLLMIDFMTSLVPP
jgi:hypothetical protein